jgi:hypothetical protein
MSGNGARQYGKGQCRVSNSSFASITSIVNWSPAFIAYDEVILLRVRVLMMA